MTVTITALGINKVAVAAKSIKHIKIVTQHTYQNIPITKYTRVSPPLASK